MVEIKIEEIKVVVVSLAEKVNVKDVLNVVVKVAVEVVQRVVTIVVAIAQLVVGFSRELSSHWLVRRFCQLLASFK